MQLSYRGYTVRETLIRDGWNISKDGHHIASARTADDARRIIDDLLGE